MHVHVAERSLRGSLSLPSSHRSIIDIDRLSIGYAKEKKKTKTKDSESEDQHMLCPARVVVGCVMCMLESYEYESQNENRILLKTLHCHRTHLLRYVRITSITQDD